MSKLFEKGDKVMKVINKYSLLVGGICSLINGIISYRTNWEMIAWICASMFALSGFSQIVELENKINNNEDNIS